MTVDDAKVIGIIGGLVVSSIALLLNFFSTARSIKSQKIANYQEITKSHRDLWKLTIDDDAKYGRVLELAVNLMEIPPTYPERRFVQLVLLHMTSAFYFGKHSHMLEIEKMSMDFEEFLSLPIPRLIWQSARKYHNSDFVSFVEKGKPAKQIKNFIRHRVMGKKVLDTKKLWNVLLLSGFPELVADRIKGYGDTVICMNDNDPHITKKYIKDNDIDIVVCFGYGRIIKKEIIDSVTCINVHASYLPYNRGPNPNLWSWIDGTPKGATVHYIDEGIDTGDIISRSEINFGEGETLKSALDKLFKECARLFNETWPKIRAGEAAGTPQEKGGTAYSFKSQEVLKELFNDEWINKPIDEFCEEARKRIANQA